MFSKLKNFLRRKQTGEEADRGRGWRTWRLPCFKNRAYPATGSHPQVIKVLPPPAAVAPAACGEHTSPATSPKEAGSLRCSLAALGQSVKSICPEDLASEAELMRCSLGASEHSLAEAIHAEDQAGLMDGFVLWRGQAVQDGPNEKAQCSFLSSIVTACLSSLVKGEEQLDMPQTKAELVAKVMGILEQVVANPTPGNILPCTLVALHHLSKMKPRTPRDLEDRFLELALRAVFSLEEPRNDYVGQTLYRSSHQTLEVLLLGLLDEDPTSGHLFAILDHLRAGLRSLKDRERAWASGKIAGLLRRAVLLQQFDNTDDSVGRYMAELGISLLDPKKQVGRHAREGLYRLYELALQQMGINIREAEDIWCKEARLDWQMASYVNTMRMAKILGGLLSAEQRLAFLNTALEAVWDPAPHISRPALFLLYSYLNLGEDLLGRDAQATEAKVRRQLRRFRECGKQPMELRCLLAGKDDVLIDDLEEEEEEEEEAASMLV